MRNISVTVDRMGKATVSAEFLGYGGEHNAVELTVSFTEDGYQIYSQADYFRVVVDGVYSDELYISQKNISYTVPQEAMRPPRVHCQLIGYKVSGGEIESIIKSQVFDFAVNASEVPFKCVENQPDIFEKTLAECTEAAESAKGYAEATENKMLLAVQSAAEALNSAAEALSSKQSAQSGADTALANAVKAANNAERAERAAKVLDTNNLSNALKGKVSGESVVIKDISPLPNSVKIQLKNSDGSPLQCGTETVIPETVINPGTTGSGDWGNDSWTLKYSPLEVGVDNLTVSATLNNDVYITPVINGEYVLGENFECHFIANHWQYGEETVNITYKIEDGVLSWNGTVTETAGGASEPEFGSFEYVLSADEKLTGIVVMSEMPNDSNITFMVTTKTGPEINVLVGGKNLVNCKNYDTEISPNTLLAENPDSVFPETFKEDTQYTVSVDCDVVSGTGNGDFGLQVNYTNSTYSNLMLVEGGAVSENLKITTALGRTVSNIQWSYNQQAPLFAYFKNMQIEEGTSATEYEPYIEPKTYTANSDGTVDGIKSLYPTTILSTDTDGVTIECEYNRDINKSSGIEVDLTEYVKHTDINQSYDPTSKNAQSGVAVTEAIAIEQKRANNTFANALKGSKSGSAILIDDVSSVSHEMRVKISSDTVTDLTAVKVSRCGKNLFDKSNLKLGAFTKKLTQINNGFTFQTSASNKTSFVIYSIFLGAGTYYCSGTINSSDGLKGGWGIYDHNKPGFVINRVNSGTINASFTITESKMYGLHFYAPLQSVADVTITCTNVQLELGTTATDYEPYKECAEYTPNADGTVEGVLHLYPNTTLTTDTEGVLIDCEYNRDVNKAFAELQAAIISLGGNV